MLLLLAACAFGADKTPPPPPAAENLQYALTGPGGMKLGTAHLTAREAAKRWDFEFTLDASVPGYRILDRYHAETNPDLCALEFDRSLVHGQRRTVEKTTFDYAKAIAIRQTAAGGGKSEIPIGSCARDALGFLAYARRELQQGRVPAAQTVMAGASYQVRLEAGGTQPVPVGGKTEEADAVVISIKGPASNVSVEAFFARDKARTPLLVRCPFPIGMISLELVR